MAETFPLRPRSNGDFRETFPLRLSETFPGGQLALTIDFGHFPRLSLDFMIFRDHTSDTSLPPLGEGSDRKSPREVKCLKPTMHRVAIVTFMNTEAPNIAGEYPLAGERIGPAWRAAWRMLDREQWINGGDVAAAVAPRCGLQVETVKNLLSSARRAGLLEQRIQRAHGRSRASAHYRVK
jgi:hypothetical protein